MWLISLSDQLKTTKDNANSWAVGFQALADLGVTGYCYAATISPRSSLASDLSQMDLVQTNYLRDLQRAALGPQILKDDFTARRIVEAGQDTIWHDQTAWQTATAAEISRAEIERDLGINLGVSLTCSFERGFVSGLDVSMADMTEASFDLHFDELSPKLRAIAALLDHHVRQERLSAHVGLSPREAECLTWTAAGFRPDQIAHRLGIGYRTVDKYMVSARRKLNARTRDQAVAKALMLNLIDP